MPAFRDTLDAGQASDLAAYLRTRFSKAGPWPNLRATVEGLWPASRRQNVASKVGETHP
ncbi:MAG: hypothetical protein INR63_24575 [Actinomycetospora chiangmaiensis]|nr:hypothetical protein [Actinomycetospora chiangmaiensis]